MQNMLEIFLWTLTTLVFHATTFGCIQTAGERKETEFIIALLERADHERWKVERMVTEMSQIPREQAISAILDVFELKKGTFIGAQRIIAYKLLELLDAETTPRGFEQLLRCLKDAPSIQQICCLALGQEVVSKELEKVKERIAHDQTSDDERKSLVTMIGGWGKFADGASGLIEQLLRKEDSSENLRAAAALATLRIRGLESAIESFNNLSPIQEKVVLWSATQYIGERGYERGWETPPEDRKGREMARRMVLNAMKSPHLENRKAAAEALLVVFGMDVAVGNEVGGYQIDTDYAAAFDYMAKNEPDEVLRKQAQWMVDRFDSTVENVLRNRERDNR